MADIDPAVVRAKSIEQNEDLGRRVAQKMRESEALYPSNPRSRAELRGTLEDIRANTNAALSKTPGTGTHSDIVDALLTEAALCLRGVKHLPTP